MLLTNKDASKLPNIIQLREMLQDAIPRFPVLHRKPFEQELTNRNKFIVTPLDSHRYSLKPNITQQGVLFHGSKQVYEKFTPKMFSDGRPDYLKENVIYEAFQIIMESHPLYTILKEGVVINNNMLFSVYNPYGLAACYGLKTPFIQLTSDLDTAIMYAITAESNSGLRRYLTPRDSETGVLYIFELYNTFGIIKGLSTLGLQPFERPGRMKEFLFQMDERTNFNNFEFVKGLVFRHDLEAERTLLETIQRPKITDSLSNKLSTLNISRSDGTIDLPIEALHRNTEHNGLNQIEENNNREKLENSGFINFKTDCDSFIFKEEVITQVNLRAKWYHMCSLLSPLIPSDMHIIEGLLKVPDDPKYSLYFDWEQWLNREQ